MLKEELPNDYFSALMNLLMDTSKQRKIFPAPCCQTALAWRVQSSWAFQGDSAPPKTPLTCFLYLPVNMQAMCLMNVLEKVSAPLADWTTPYVLMLSWNVLPNVINPWQSVNTVNHFYFLWFLLVFVGVGSSYSCFFATVVQSDVNV